jgi:hypothetical protein
VIARRKNPSHANTRHHDPTWSFQPGHFDTFTKVSDHGTELRVWEYEHNWMWQVGTVFGKTRQCAAAMRAAERAAQHAEGNAMRIHVDFDRVYSAGADVVERARTWWYTCAGTQGRIGAVVLTRDVDAHTAEDAIRAALVQGGDDADGLQVWPFRSEEDTVAGLFGKR